MKVALLLATSLMLPVCSPEPCPEADEVTECDAYVRGACVTVRGAVEWSPEALEDAIDEGARYWRTDRETVLAGWTLALYAERPDVCDPHAGCCDRSCRWIRLSDPLCVEWLLPHEMGHVVLGGDNEHADPRWRATPQSCFRPAGY